MRQVSCWVTEQDRKELKEFKSRFSWTCSSHSEVMTAVVEAGEVENLRSGSWRSGTITGPSLWWLQSSSFQVVHYGWSRWTKPRESQMPESSTSSIRLLYVLWEFILVSHISMGLYDSLFTHDQRGVFVNTSQFKEKFLQRLLNR